MKQSKRDPEIAETNRPDLLLEAGRLFVRLVVIAGIISAAGILKCYVQDCVRSWAPDYTPPPSSRSYP